MSGISRNHPCRFCRWIYDPKNEIYFKIIGIVAIALGILFLTTLYFTVENPDQVDNKLLSAVSVILGAATGPYMAISILNHGGNIWNNGILRGAILDLLLPHEEAEHRILELDEAMDRWVMKYGPKKAEILYAWQSLISAALFWFDRVVVKVLARK